jgi:hypothetical protein
MADLEALAEGTEHVPPSAITYSREDIYFDHDGWPTSLTRMFSFAPQSETIPTGNSPSTLFAN